MTEHPLIDPIRRAGALLVHLLFVDRPARAMSDAETDPGHGPEQPTVLVRMSPEVVRLLERVGWSFGEPDADGFHTPVVYFVDLPAGHRAGHRVDGSHDCVAMDCASLGAELAELQRFNGAIATIRDAERQGLLVHVATGSTCAEHRVCRFHPNGCPPHFRAAVKAWIARGRTPIPEPGARPYARYR